MAGKGSLMQGTAGPTQRQLAAVESCGAGGCRSCALADKLNPGVWLRGSKLLDTQKQG